MKRVDVMFRAWGEDWLLGVLADDGSSILFEYSAEALRRGIEFSRRHLPLKAQTFSGFPAHLDGLPGLVSDALPDGWGLLLMDRLFRKSGCPRSTTGTCRCGRRGCSRAIRWRSRRRSRGASSTSC